MGLVSDGLTAEQWRRLGHEARVGAAIAPNPKMKTIRLLIGWATEVILAELEAGEAPAPAPLFSSLSVGEGRGGSDPRPRPRAPQGNDQ